MTRAEQVDELCSFLGEGFHTAFRKVTDSETGTQIWKLIQELDPDEWHQVLLFVAEPLMDAWPIGGAP
jgi:hypothetical protein